MCAENSLVFSAYACDIWAGASFFLFIFHTGCTIYTIKIIVFLSSWNLSPYLCDRQDPFLLGWVKWVKHIEVTTCLM